MRKLLCLALLLTGCAHWAASPSATGTVTHVTKEAPLPAPPANARALVPAPKITEATEQPFHELEWDTRKLRVYSGRTKIEEQSPGWNRMYGWGPVVAMTEKGKTRVLDLRAELASWYVAQVFHDRAGGRILLFLDYGIEGPAPAYKVWLSEDGGEHWFPGADLPRPPGEFPPADLEALHLNARGAGTAWFRLGAGNFHGPGARDFDEREDLFFTATTKDGGRTWQTDPAPRFGNVLEQAEERHHR